MLRRRPPLPEALHDAWWTFVACAEIIEGGRRHLLGTLPAGRVEPAPVEVGLEALAHAIDESRAIMDVWRLPEVAGAWSRCSRALDEVAEALPAAQRVAATADELEDLLDAVHEVVEPLAVFGEAERAWRKRWRLPAERKEMEDSS
ncbi:MAG: hypothetical protein M3133_04800 [Actinomycetota bacterium]|nr:hypothetical protein [Actinomycetota bacterium]